MTPCPSDPFALWVMNGRMSSARRAVSRAAAPSRLAAGEQEEEEEEEEVHSITYFRAISYRLLTRAGVTRADARTPPLQGDAVT